MHSLLSHRLMRRSGRAPLGAALAGQLLDCGQRDGQQHLADDVDDRLACADVGDRYERRRAASLQRDGAVGAALDAQLARLFAERRHHLLVVRQRAREERLARNYVIREQRGQRRLVAEQLGSLAACLARQPLPQRRNSFVRPDVGSASADEATAAVLADGSPPPIRRMAGPGRARGEERERATAAIGRRRQLLLQRGRELRGEARQSGERWRVQQHIQDAHAARIGAPQAAPMAAMTSKAAAKAAAAESAASKSAAKAPKGWDNCRHDGRNKDHRLVIYAEGSDAAKEKWTRVSAETIGQDARLDADRQDAPRPRPPRAMLYVGTRL